MKRGDYQKIYYIFLVRLEQCKSSYYNVLLVIYSATSFLFFNRLKNDILYINDTKKLIIRFNEI